MKFKIDREMLPMKAHYFFFNAGTYPVVSFLPTLIRQLGFSTVIVGTIYTILPVVGLLSNPIFGAVSDRYRLQRLLFLTFQILTAIAFFCINLIPQAKHNAAVSFHCGDGISQLRYCPNGAANYCAVTNLIQAQPNNAPNSLFECHLTCSVPEKWMMDFICEKWENNKNCNSSRREFKMLTTSNLNHIKRDRDDKDFCLLFLIAKTVLIDEGKEHHIMCPTKANMSQYIRVDCEGKCNNDIVMRTITEEKFNNNDVVKMIEFWMLLIFLSIAWAGKSVILSLADAMCLSLLGERSHLYGNQRLWGLVGWGVFSVIAGLLVDILSGSDENKNYGILFYMVLILLGFDFWWSLEIKNVQTQRPTSIMKDLDDLFFSLPVIIFFTWCVIIGLCAALVWNFLFWHLENLADQGCAKTSWMKTLQGLAMAIQCFGGELPFFFLSGWILKKIGHINAMSLVLIGFGVRFLLYSALTNPWWVLPIELFQVVTFGLFYSTMTSYASIIAPIGAESTLQNLVGPIFEGVGVSMGSFIGGIMFERAGSSQTFQIYGIAVLVFCALHFRLLKLLQKHANAKDSRNTAALYNTPKHALNMLEDHVPERKFEL